MESIMPTDIVPITYGTFYHIYNRGNNRENIFVEERNYAYFLELWWTGTRYQPHCGDVGILSFEKSFSYGRVYKK